MRILLGLGNPGPEYEGTRHNLGFEVVRKAAGRLRVRLREGRGPALAARIGKGPGEALLACPLTWMNLSGEALERLDPGRSAAPSDVLVVCDDLALPVGRLRLRKSGSDGGHNGLKSIERHLGSAAYPRLRIGIGPLPPGAVGADFVLERPAAEERTLLDRAIAEAVHAVLAWLDSTPVETLMNRLNRDPAPPKAPRPPRAERPDDEEPPPPRSGGDHHRA